MPEPNKTNRKEEHKEENLEKRDVQSKIRSVFQVNKPTKNKRMKPKKGDFSEMEKQLEGLVDGIKADELTREKEKSYQEGFDEGLKQQMHKLRISGVQLDSVLIYQEKRVSNIKSEIERFRTERRAIELERQLHIQHLEIIVMNLEDKKNERRITAQINVEIDTTEDGRFGFLGSPMVDV